MFNKLAVNIFRDRSQDLVGINGGLRFKALPEIYSRLISSNLGMAGDFPPAAKKTVDLESIIQTAIKDQFDSGPVICPGKGSAYHPRLLMDVEQDTLATSRLNISGFYPAT